MQTIFLDTETTGLRGVYAGGKDEIVELRHASIRRVEGIVECALWQSPLAQAQRGGEGDGLQGRGSVASRTCRHDSLSASMASFGTLQVIRIETDHTLDSSGNITSFYEGLFFVED